MPRLIHIGTRLAAVLAALLLFHGIDTGSLLPSDDSIYTRAALEGTRAGKLADVTWMGHPLFEKGPVLFSAIQLAALAGGPIELQARLPGILFGLLILVLIYRIGLDLGLSRTAAMLSAALLLSSSVFYFNARRPMTDIPGLMFALAGFRAMSVGRSTGQLFVGGAMFGLSALCKLSSPVPFAIAALAARLAGYRPDSDKTGNDEPTPMTKWIFAGAAGALLTAAPWHLWMYAVHGSDFINTYFGFHLFGRMARTIVGAGAVDTYTGWLLGRDPFLTAVLAICIPPTLIAAVRRDRSAVAALLLLLMAALPLMLSATALPHYLVPVSAGAVLVAGFSADRLLSRLAARTAARNAVAGVMATVCIGSFVNGNLADLLDPDYGHDSKALCEIMRNDRSAARIAGTFDLHDMALPLYCDMEMKIFMKNPGFIRAVADIPMLKPVLSRFRNNDLNGFADTAETLVCNEHGLQELRDIAEESGLELKVRTFGRLYAVSASRR